MSGLTVHGKDEMITPVWAGKSFWLALFTADADDAEVVDSLYSRQEIIFGGVHGEADTRYVLNSDMVRFEGFNNRHLVDHWGAYGMDGKLYCIYPIRDPQTGAATTIEVSPSNDCKFRPGELKIGLP